MVKIDKSPLPAGVNISSERDYRSDPVISILNDDCRGKCYICEIKAPTSLNVEHRVPHKGNLKLKYDWNNLFMSCDHCNRVKSDKYEGIIDPSKVDPEKFISLSLVTGDLRPEINVDMIADLAGVAETIALLEQTYCANSPAARRLECGNLRALVMKEMSDFHNVLENYRREPNLEIKEGLRGIIADNISRSSSFAAFKRKIVRDDSNLSKDFMEDLAHE
jgi:uncharacterized protein (TIGR02646 family)